MHTHLLGRKVEPKGQAIAQVFVVTILVNGDCGLVSVFDSPDDVLWPERRIAAEKDALTRAHHRCLIDFRAIPLVEFDADIAFDPRECIVLTDREDDIVTGNDDLARGCAAVYASLLVDLVFHEIELHADELAVLVDEFSWRMIDNDLDVFLFGAEPQRGAAAVHRRVADADN